MAKTKSNFYQRCEMPFLVAPAACPTIPGLRLAQKLAVLLCLGLALPAHAECVTADSLARGVAFKREDGRTGLIRAEGKAFTIDYASNSKGPWLDQRISRLGIYDTEWHSNPTEDYIVGGGPGGDFTFKFAGKPPEPKADTSWSTTVSERKSLEAGLQSGPEITRTAYKVIYSFQGTKTAKLSGCTYTIQPVEAHFTNKDTDLTRRFIYFPDLGFGLETRVIDRKGKASRKVGLTALTPKG